MAEAGVFGEVFYATVTELAYFKLSGRAEAGRRRGSSARSPINCAM